MLTFFSENTNTSRATRDNIIYISTLTQNHHHVLVKKLYTSVKNLDIWTLHSGSFLATSFPR